MLSFSHDIAYLLLVQVLQIQCITLLRAAKVKHIAIICSDIEPIIAPKKAPIPVVIPDKIT